MILRAVFLCVLSLLLDNGAFAQRAKSTFVRLEFAGVASIEVPRNWKFLDAELRRHLNTSTEATLKISGLSITQGDNHILVAANAYSSNRHPSATLRLSVRFAESPTQAKIREFAQLPRAEQEAAFAPVLAETRRAVLSTGAARSFSVTNRGVAAGAGFLCTMTGFEITYDDGKHANQTYVCPFGDRTVKLTTSYRVSEAHLFRPVAEYVWRSLRVQ